jgi:hypothetical protein
MKKLSKSRFHLVFSILMAAIMLFPMTFVVTLVNVGRVPDFVAHWMKSFAVAYVVAVPLIYFLAPFVRGLAARLAESPDR